MAPRSHRLTAPQAVATAVTTIYTVPAGKTTIIRSVLIANLSGVSRTIHVEVQVPPAGGVEVGKYVIGGAADSVNLLPYLVLESGDNLRMYASGASCNVVVSGAELDNS